MSSFEIFHFLLGIAWLAVALPGQALDEHLNLLGSARLAFVVQPGEVRRERITLLLDQYSPGNKLRNPVGTLEENVRALRLAWRQTSVVI